MGDLGSPHRAESKEEFEAVLLSFDSGRVLVCILIDCSGEEGGVSVEGGAWMDLLEGLEEVVGGVELSWREREESGDEEEEG